MILYNVSMNKTGLRYLLELHVEDTLSHCLQDESSEKKSSEEMQLLCLRVLQSVTYDLTKPEYIRDLTRKIPIEIIESMTSAPRSDISGAAKQVVRHLRDGQKILANCPMSRTKPSRSSWIGGILSLPPPPHSRECTITPSRVSRKNCSFDFSLSETRR